MPYLIDGHNLIPNIPGFDLKEVDDEMRLVELLQAFSRQIGKRTEVFFDNAPPGEVPFRKFGLVKAHFIRSGRTADQAILQRLRHLGRDSLNWTVVSSDREVQRHAAAHHARVIGSEDFAHQLNRIVDGHSIQSSDKNDTKLSKTEVAEWLRLFNEDE
jgi:predicted RNA-binding protein with PIN domain